MRLASCGKCCMYSPGTRPTLCTPRWRGCWRRQCRGPCTQSQGPALSRGCLSLLPLSGHCEREKRGTELNVFQKSKVYLMCYLLHLRILSQTISQGRYTHIPHNLFLGDLWVVDGEFCPFIHQIFTHMDRSRLSAGEKKEKGTGGWWPNENGNNKMKKT